MNEEVEIVGLEAKCGETAVFVAPHPASPGSYAVRLETGDMVTKFGVSAATLECVLGLMMRQGGIRLPGFNATFILSPGKAEDA